jgi:arylsulfatase A-like enzyme
MGRISAALLTLSLLAAMPAAVAAKAPRHNVVVVMTDDQDFRSMGAMPKTVRLLGKQGTTFTHGFVSFPLCCPSRATYYTGQYAHNHGVKWNNFPQGGFYKLRQDETFPVWLQRAGYTTIHIGKYLNETDQRDGRHTEVPKGWSDYYGGVDPSTYSYYGYTINHNGKLKTYGTKPSDYSTDVYAGLAVSAIKKAVKKGKPFFLGLAPNAPHTVAVESGATREGSPAVPAPRDANVFADAELPRYPNFDEADISDKPAQLQALYPKPMTDDEILSLTEHYRGRMGSLLAVDDMVAKVVKTLKQQGVWDDTDIVFTSDNGWILGEHRLRDPVTETGRPSGVKYVPFEGSARVPLIMAGPDFPKNRKVKGVVINADLAETIQTITGARPKIAQDGRSLVPVARKPALLNGRGVLLETFENPRGVSPYVAIRTERYLYSRQPNGEIGLVDYKRDPWEMQSDKQKDPAYAAIAAKLSAALDQLETCKGKTCQVDVGTLPEPGR